MLIGGDDISNDVITLGACFQVFFKVCLYSRSFPQRRSCKLSFLFPPCRQSAPESLLAGKSHEPKVKLP